MLLLFVSRRIEPANNKSSATLGIISTLDLGILGASFLFVLLLERIDTNLTMTVVDRSAW